MTTSYETGVSSVQERLDKYGTQPNHNAAGHQIWNPEVGIYHKPAFGEADSYGGIVGALQDIQVQNNVLPKAYPHNFAGIIAAIQDLTFSQAQPPVIPGPDPGNGQIIIDIDGKPNYEIISELPDGTLWFDTRQGRLFVSIDNEWYQTNGADGLPIVTNTSAAPVLQNPIPGQFWWDSSNNNLFIFDGIYSLDGGGFTDDPTLGGTPVWKLVTDGLSEAFQDTCTLPLCKMKSTVTDGVSFNYITLPDASLMDVQADYNVWLYSALTELDQAVEDKQAVTVGEAPPDTPKSGDFWYDTEALELSIWYDDGDTQQWVPTATAYSYDEDLARLGSKILTEKNLREAAVSQINSEISSIKSGDFSAIEVLETKISALEDHVNNHPQDVDLTPYATKGLLQNHISNIQQSVANVQQNIPNISHLAEKANLASLENTVSQLPTSADVTTAIATAQPDLSSYVTQQHIDNSISNITAEYLPRTGGTLSGSFVVQKEDMSAPAFDFSNERWYSYNTHKYITNGPGTNYASFGTNEKAWEYAWNFGSNEDFCWVYADTDKVFSITKDGPACSQLYIGDFQHNDNNNGRVLTNKIDVKERLQTYQLAFEQMRQGVANATDFDSLKSNILTALANV